MSLLRTQYLGELRMLELPVARDEHSSALVIAAMSIHVHFLRRLMACLAQEISTISHWKRSGLIHQYSNLFVCIVSQANASNVITMEHAAPEVVPQCHISLQEGWIRWIPCVLPGVYPCLSEKYD
jgi:hypothetical protein